MLEVRHLRTFRQLRFSRLRMLKLIAYMHDLRIALLAQLQSTAISLYSHVHRAIILADAMADVAVECKEV